jgi:hypothetical protein
MILELTKFEFIFGCFVIFTIGFLLPFVLKQLGVNIL